MALAAIDVLRCHDVSVAYHKAIVTNGKTWQGPASKGGRVSDEPIILERDGAVARLVLNRPDKKNAITEAMWAAVPGLVEAAEADAAVKVVVLASAAPGVFSAGADIAEFTEIAADPERRRSNQRAVRAAQDRLMRCEKPTLAEIDGACVGGGCGLALACDIRLASGRSRFGITPVKLGLVYSLEDAKRLVDLVGPAHAKSILFTGRLLDAAEAGRIGLVNDVMSVDDLGPAVAKLAGEIAAASQFGVRGIKHILGLVRDGHAADTPETLQMFLDAYDGEDLAEGVAAFLEKRKPRFTYS